MSWNKEKIHETVERQRSFFKTGKTLDVSFRKRMLREFGAAVRTHENDLQDALSADLGRTAIEGYMCDVGATIAEINELASHVKRWARPELHFSGITCFPSVFTRVYKMPYGVTLVISPFNFPIYLSLVVVATSIAAGNAVILKTSSKSKACTEVIKKIIAETFPEEYVTLIDGGHDVADMCLEERF
ncbi:MAG: aldehyde dehydrogenase family protein, partial [Clostridiales bacterium]|nr:aldehyde dehydrogenase family protein [Clostridiales bacterium]